MKFSKLLELLKKSPFFQNHLPDASFLPYKELKDHVKEIKKCTDENEKQELIQEFNKRLIKYLTQWQDLSDAYIKNQELTKHVQFIKQYKALKQFRRINSEGTRKIAKKFDKQIQPSNPKLQREILSVLQQSDNKFVEEQFTMDEFEVIEQIDGLFKKDVNPILEQEYMKDIFSHLVQSQKLMKQPKLPWRQAIARYWRKNQMTLEISITMFLVFGMPIYLASPIMNSGASTINTISVISWITAFLLGYAIGGNDICNSVGTSYGCHIITLRNSLILGSIAEFLGGLAMGSGVAKTLTKDIITPDAYNDEPVLFALCFPGVLMGAGVTCILATLFGIPVSVSQFMIFGLVAAGLGSKGPDVIGTSGIIKVLVALVASPFVGLIVAFGLFYFILKVINASDQPYEKAKFYQPLLAFISIGFSVFFVFFEGFEDMKWYWAALIAAGCGVLVGVVLIIYEKYKTSRKIHREDPRFEIDLEKLKRNSEQEIELEKQQIDQQPELQDLEQQSPNQQSPEKLFTDLDTDKQAIATQDFQQENKQTRYEQDIKKCYSLFAPLLLLSAFLVAFAHGGNHVGHGVGPLLAVLDVQKNGEISEEVEIPYWGLAFGGGSFIAGIMSIGGRTVQTVGSSLTTLDPMKAFSTQIGAAIAILISSVMGLPVSTSHCLVGSIIGSFFAEKLNKIPTNFQMKMLVKIGISWIITFPIAMFMTLFFYYSLKGVVWDCYLASS